VLGGFGSSDQAGSIADAAGDIARWRTEAAAILASVNAHGFNAKIGAFVQSYGSEVLDASVLGSLCKA
jgi:GH15 family glucan-1,4-alpha-glucosidase